MQLIAHLNFNGNCEAAFNFYRTALGGQITSMMRQGESPIADQVPAAMKDKIMHASLQVPDGGVLMGADLPQGKNVTPAGFCVSVQVNTTAEAERLFSALSVGGQIQMEFQKTFWSPGFGMCVDKFEIPWMINCSPGA